MNNNKPKPDILPKVLVDRAAHAARKAKLDAEADETYTEDCAERDALEAESHAAEAAAKSNGRVNAHPSEPPPNYIEFADKFLSVEDPPTRYLIDELLPERVIALLHGEPRTRKSWATLEIAIALATGTPAFGLERFNVPAAVPVLYSSQEDSVRVVRQRANALLLGRGIERIPKTLAFSVHRGIDLESPQWHKILLHDVAHHDFRFVAFDPIRRYALNADKGPAEVRAITGYLRRFVTETAAAVAISHHDSKPPAIGTDNRRRGHRASGGDWFAAAECPIAFETAGETSSLVCPESYKLSMDPAPFTFRLETDDPRDPKIARLIAETATAQQAADIAVQEKILSYLTTHHGASGSAIAKGAHIGKAAALAALHQLSESGKVDCAKTGQNGRAITWFVTTT